MRNTQKIVQMKKLSLIFGLILSVLLFSYFVLKQEPQFSDIKELNLNDNVKYYELSVFENNIENKNNVWQPTSLDSVEYIEKHYFDKNGMNDSMVVLYNNSKNGLISFYKSKTIYTQSTSNNEYSKMYDEDSKVILTTEINWISKNNYKLYYSDQQNTLNIEEEIWLNEDFVGTKFEKKVYHVPEINGLVQHTLIERFLDDNKQISKEVVHDKILKSSRTSNLIIQKKDNASNPTELVYMENSKIERLEIRKYEYYLSFE